MIDNPVNVSHFDSCRDAQTLHICGDKRCQTVGRYSEKYCLSMNNRKHVRLLPTVYCMVNLLMLNDVTNLKKLNIDNIQLLH
jgi:hypothetical protein